MDVTKPTPLNDLWQRAGLRGGWALVQSTWISWMQYRSFFFVLAFGWMVPPLAALFVWLAATGQGSIGGLGRGQFVAYYLTLVLVNQFTYAQANWTVGDHIRLGNLNTWLMRPLPTAFNPLADEIAGKVVTLVFVIPVSLVLAVLLRPAWNSDLAHVLLFIPALIMAWALRFLWGYALALLAFWSSRADALLALQDALVFIFSGIVAPTALLPGGLQIVARWLPFRYMIGYPVEVLVQQPDVVQLWQGFALQAGWLVVAALMTALLWRVGLRRYTALGG
jgi:ABC-2 type transport system permease protein